MFKDYFGELEPEEPFVPLKNSYKVNFEGQRFGKWVVLKKLKKGKYTCKCDCGYIGDRPINLLISLKTSQCKKCFKTTKECYFFAKGKL